MDLQDKAQEREEEFRNDALSAVRRKSSLEYTGLCHNCEAPIEVGCFCDADCRDDYDRREKLKGRHAGSN